MTDYRPIDCGVYSGYEIAILRRRLLRLAWAAPGGVTRIDNVRPLDLKTRSSEEFLLAEDSSGRLLEIRLDHISRCAEIPGPQASDSRKN